MTRAQQGPIDQVPRSGAEWSRATEVLHRTARAGIIAEQVHRLLDGQNELLGVARALNVECDDGYFARLLADMGLNVDAIDEDPAAIRHCLRHAIGGDRYRASTLASWDAAQLYDVVLAVDALARHGEPTHREMMLRLMCASLRLGGRLLIFEAGIPDGPPPMEILGLCGIRVDDPPHIGDASSMVMYLGTKVAS